MDISVGSNVVTEPRRGEPGRGVLVGVDGGGTKTDALVVDAAGRVLGIGAAGPSNWEIVGIEGMAAAVGAAVRGALDVAGLDAGDVDAAAFALAGCDWPSDHARIMPSLAALGLRGEVLLANDAVAALRAGTHERDGIVSVAGTGGSTTGRNRHGITFRTFAISFGEGRGASGIVRAALHEMARAYHGQIPATLLTERWCGALGAEDASTFFEALSRGDRRAASPDLAPIVSQCVRDGDDAAQRVVRAAALQHGADVVGVARHLGMLADAFDVVCAGGVHRGDDPLFRDTFRDAVRASVPGARFVTLETPPVVGAALLAFELLDATSFAIDARVARDAIAADVARRIPERS